MVATGTNSPFQYQLGEGSFSANPIISNVLAGTYYVTVKVVTTLCAVINFRLGCFWVYLYSNRHSCTAT